MRNVTIILSVLIVAWLSKANACDEPTNFGAFIVVTSSTLGSTIIFPLVGRKIDDRENPPYWRAIGLTAVASSAGAWIAISTLEDSNCDVEFGYFGYPAFFGAIATYLSYRVLPRRIDTTSGTLWQYSPQVSLLPLTRGGSLRFNWTF